jgi:hypothetical protein
MAYKRDQERILTGGMNLLPPGDKLAEGESLEVTNFRVDQQGQLRSRQGFLSLITAFNALSSNDTVLHSMFRYAAHRYYGANADLFRDGGAAGNRIATNTFDGNPLGMVAYQGFVWVMNQAAQVKDNGSLGGVWVWTPSAPATAPTIGALLATGLTGSFQWYVTFSTAAAHESNPSPASATAVLANQQVTLGIPVSADPQVTIRRVWRANVTAGSEIASIYLDLVVNDNTSTTCFVGSNSDATLQALGEIMPQTNDPAPPCLGVCECFGKLIAWNSIANPNRFWWTPTAQPWYFPGSDDPNAGQWNDCGASDEAILAIVPHGSYCTIYKERTIWQLPGDPNSYDPTLTSANVGLQSIVGSFNIGAQTVCSAGLRDYFWGAVGIYSFNSLWEELRSGKIDPMFKGDLVVLATDSGGSVTLQIQPVVAFQAGFYGTGLQDFNGLLYFAYTDQDTTAYFLVFNIQSGTWVRFSFPGTLATGAPQSLYYEGQGRSLLAGAAPTFPGPCAAFEIDRPYAGGLKTYCDNMGGVAVAIPLAWHSRYSDQGAPDRQKTYEDLVIEYVTGNAGGYAMLDVDVYFDNGLMGNVLGVGTIGSAFRTKQHFPLNISGDTFPMHTNMAVRISGSTEWEVIIYAVYVHYYLEPRDAIAFDSGYLSLGDELVKQLDRLEIDFTATGAVLWVLWSDLPGGTAAAQEAGTFAALATRGTPPVAIFPAIVEGHRVRLTLTANEGTFRLYGARVRRRVLGAYVDGINNDNWLSDVLNLGDVEDVKLYRLIELDVDTTAGPMNLDVLTDQTGTAGMAQALPSPVVPATSGRGFVKLAMNSTVKGRYLQLRLWGYNTARLYGVRVYAKSVGKANAVWTWYPVPIPETATQYTWADLPLDE